MVSTEQDIYLRYLKLFFFPPLSTMSCTVFRTCLLNWLSYCLYPNPNFTTTAFQSFRVWSTSSRKKLDPTKWSFPGFLAEIKRTFCYKWWWTFFEQLWGLRHSAVEVSPICVKAKRILVRFTFPRRRTWTSCVAAHLKEVLKLFEIAMRKIQLGSGPYRVCFAFIVSMAYRILFSAECIFMAKLTCTWNIYFWRTPWYHRQWIIHHFPEWKNRKCSLWYLFVQVFQKLWLDSADFDLTVCSSTSPNSF